MDYPFMLKDRSPLRRSIVTLIAAALVTACVDASDPVAPANLKPATNEAEGRGFAQRLYAIGTSISAGTCSDGNVSSCQQNSWVAQLIRAMHREPTLPLIQAPGCKSPIAAPLSSFVRQSGESLAIPDASLSCAPNESSVTLPTQILAIPGSWTHEAQHQTPATRTDPYGAQLYRRILPLNESQVTALEKVNPKFVTVELGANDILQVVSGIVYPGVTYAPFATWSAVYDDILDRVGAVTKQALLVGLGSDMSKLAGLRRGHEFWADRAGFLAFNVLVSANCDGNHNLITVPYVVPAAVATGHFYFLNNLGPYTLSCAAASSPITRDNILNASEEAQANALFVQMRDHIRDEAEERGYAYMDLDVLLNTAKPAFSVVTLMTSTTAPYGAYFSFDGIHPSAAGQTLIAQAALQAIEARYKTGFDP
jgi:lysophospholipase L1-like esterase